MELRAAREASGKTQAQVASESGITVIAYQRYEYNKREPRARMAVRVAESVGSTVEKIWGSCSIPSLSRTEYQKRRKDTSGTATIPGGQTGRK